VVTGASSGIGAEFARQLAGAGLAVVAVARRQGLLEALAGEIHDKGGRCEVLAADLTDASDRMRVGEVIAQPDVAMLVNNAGASTHGEFLQVPWSLAGTMVTLNVAAVVELSRWAADAFAARGRGAILNVSSTAAFKPMAGLVVYGATKAFVKEFSLGLRLEVAARGVDVCVVFPGPVRTPMIESAIGRPIAPAGRVGHYLERAWFMMPRSAWTRPSPGSASARPRWWSTRSTAPLSVCPAASSAGWTTGRCAISPAPEPRRGVEAGEVAGVALEPEMRP